MKKSKKSKKIKKKASKGYSPETAQKKTLFFIRKKFHEIVQQLRSKKKYRCKPARLLHGKEDSHVEGKIKFKVQHDVQAHGEVHTHTNK